MKLLRPWLLWIFGAFGSVRDDLDEMHLTTAETSLLYLRYDFRFLERTQAIGFV